MPPETLSPATAARLGFSDGTRAVALLGAPVLDAVYDGGLRDGLWLARILAGGADPDVALLALVRILEAAQQADERAGGGLVGQLVGQLVDALSHDGARQRRLARLLGGSRALGDDLVRHPELTGRVADAEPPTAAGLREALSAAVSPQARGALSALDALRVAYRAELLAIAALDLTSPDPVATMPTTAEQLAWLAEATLEAALLIAREEVGPGHEVCRLAVIGMGKTGGGELNYLSDVDVIFVVEPADGADEQAAVQVGNRLATSLMRACSASTAEGSIWQVDPALRPEGKNGPLVRTVASHLAYYERWAKTWEFQALLKAWVSAGDLELGLAYKRAITPLVWQAASREHFVEDVQAMRRRVEQHVPPAEADRQLKLGPGGLRDVEFSVQLLQLVHGRSDATLRSATTLEALAALAKGGYVGRDDAAELDYAYRFLRTLEHRIQLFRMRRTHLMPTSEDDLRRLGRAVGLMNDPVVEVTARRAAQAREVRRIHERLFYRPLLAAVARLSSTESRLTPQAARERLAALGFRDPAGAMRHLEALTSGVSRRAQIQRHLLPVMLGWFADEADPDAGLLAFRKVSDELGSAHWYLKMLRDEGSAAERLSHVLGRSRLVADLLGRSAESIRILGDSDGLRPRPLDALRSTFVGAVTRREERDGQQLALRELRRHEAVRVMMASLVGGLTGPQARRAWSDLTEATLEAALRIAIAAVEARIGAPLGTRMLVVGMGSLGGREMSFSSDADVIYVHEPDGTVSDAQAGEQAVLVVQELAAVLGGANLDPALPVDVDLRPEGKAGPLVRSLAAYATYYERWALTWEFQALTRARVVAGNRELGERFTALIDPLRYPRAGLTHQQVRDIRTMKARVEAERLPRGADPKLHLKLGRGGMSDVEWTVQLLQLQHAGAREQLRTPSTLVALEAARSLGYVGDADAASLASAWSLAANIRGAALLWRGRGTESLPTDVTDLEGVARILGRRAGTGAQVDEDWRRDSRHARAVVERLFYGTG